MAHRFRADWMGAVDQTETRSLQRRARVAMATAAATLVAGVALVALVLPYAYGVDPLGTGAAFGLTRPAPETPMPSREVMRPGANTAEQARYRRDQRSFDLAPREGIEYKYRMTEGGAMVYAWKATGTIKVEMHGEPVGAPKGYADFYHVAEEQAGNGTFFAPTTGIHGWWWENQSDEPVTVELTSAGFFTGSIEFRRTGRTEYELED